MPSLAAGGGSAPGDQPCGDHAKVVAFYLPQFHRIPENDEWWGKGFTEWTNVRRASPQFVGHRQPRIPTALGYYDLSDPQVQHDQAKLAAAHGVSAFCYYVYWFGGSRLLERPVDRLLEQLPDQEYCLCWANENWTRGWDGLADEVLLGQVHSPETDAGFIDDVAPHLAADRYLKVDGKPLLVVYRPSLFTDPLRTADALRERAARIGVGEIFLAMVQSFRQWDPRAFGFDAAIEFPPSGAEEVLNAVGRPWEDPPAPLRPQEWQGALFSYERTVEWAMSKPPPSFPWFRGVMPGWDNTPRRQGAASVFIGDTPALFQTWVERALHYTYLFNRPQQWLLFVNAWNEWAEGAYLEPDVDSGSGRLEAIRRALDSSADLESAAAAAWAARGDGGPLLGLGRAYFRSAAVMAREYLIALPGRP